MKLVNRKTQKAIRKSLKKALKKHGPKIVAGLAASIASTLATLASTDAPGTKGRQSNLRKAVREVSHVLTGDTGKKSRKRSVRRERLAKADEGDEAASERTM
jgi:hypothetical protein